MRVRNEAYWDFAQGIRKKLINEVNGLVKFEIYDGSSEEVICDILSCYKKAILNGFFKSEDRKRREEEKRLGIRREAFT